MPDGTATAQRYLPKLVTTFREGYSWLSLRADAAAGLTVAVVALPLSMAIAVASGVTPERGLYAAIAGGAVVSLLGGSRFQIGGPAGAFIVLVAGTVQQLGLEVLLLAVLLSGAMLCIIGWLRIGTLIRYVPHAVTVGFTSGIALTIFASQLKDLGGFTLTAEPAHMVPKLQSLWIARESFAPAALVIGICTAAIILVMRRLRPNWPGMLLAIAAASLAAWAFGLPAELIGERFGDLPNALPRPRLPELSWANTRAALEPALAFTVLGGIESLLSAKVADSMSGRKHRSNMELVAQGAANIASALFGGICVTGTIARTATNIRAGARSPVSGLLHALYLLVFLLIAAPLAAFVPLSALAGVLIVVCLNMADSHEFIALLRNWRTGFVLLATFIPTILVDLMAGIAAGCGTAIVLALFGRGVKTEDSSA
ncbi:MAG: SulP family inorganic anion transporter [Rhodospirillaceae bacterium]